MTADVQQKWDFWQDELLNFTKFLKHPSCDSVAEISELAETKFELLKKKKGSCVTKWRVK